VGEEPVEEFGGEKTEAAFYQFRLGLLTGGCALLLLAGVFWGATRLGLADLFYGRACLDTLVEIGTLAKAQAHTEVVRIAEAHLQQQKLSAGCRQRLTEHLVRALTGQAEQVERAEGTHKLRQALETAEASGHRDLAQWIADKLEIVAQEHVITIQRQELATHQDMIATLQQERSALQHQIAAMQQEQAALHQALDHFKGHLTKRLQAELQARAGAVRETPEGELIVELPGSAIRFEAGKAQLTPTTLATLQQVVLLLNQEDFATRRIRVEGHADDTGDVLENDLLAAERAKQVAQALEQAGISLERLRWLGHGDRRPIASNKTEKGRQANRRVEVIIEKG
jgi:outer membrane protein OmpA-like peptidoglycan-associated protein